MYLWNYADNKPSVHRRFVSDRVICKHRALCLDLSLAVKFYSPKIHTNAKCPNFMQKFY